MPVSMGGDIHIEGDYHDHGSQHVTQAAHGGSSKVDPQTQYFYAAPLPLSPRFTGQEIYLKQLREYFQPQIDRTNGRRSFLLCGMGGVGKTQIALKFAEESAEKYWVFWVDASSVDTMEQSMKSIALNAAAKAAGIEPSGPAVLQWISHVDHEWLLIFDNADGDPNIISKYTPPGNRGNILFTSRNPMMGHHVSSSKARVDVDAMAEDDAVSLLLKSAMLDESSTDLAPQATAIVRMLYCLPLAVDQAGAAIAMGICTIQDYPYRYSIRRQDLLILPSFKGASDYGQVVYTTWELSHAAIQNGASGTSNLMTHHAAKCALFLLEIFAFFHYENISEDIFRRAAEESPNTVQKQHQDKTTVGRKIISLFSAKKRKQQTLEPSPQTLRRSVLLDLLQLDRSGNWDPHFFRNGVWVLLSFSLVKRNASGNSYSVHPLVHSWSRDRMSDDTQRAGCLSAKAFLVQSIGIKFVFTNHFVVEDYAFRRDLIPHIQSCYLHMQKAGQSRVYAEAEFIGFGQVYSENGWFKEAEELQVEVAKMRSNLLGEEHPDTLTSMFSLALTLSDQGRHSAAEEIGICVLEAREKVLGVEHPDALTCKASLAVTFWKQGRWKEAEELQVRVLDSRRKLLGTDNPDTLTAMDDLSSSLWRQGNYNEAERFAVQVLESRKRVLGENHPDTLRSMANVAAIGRDQGHYTYAEKLEVQVLELRKQVLGVEHPDTISSIANLAVTLWKQGRPEEAEELHTRVLESRKKMLGLEHPDTLWSMASLSSTLWRLRRYTEAEEAEVRVLDLRTKVIGEEHPDTLRSMANLASIYCDQGRFMEAEKLEERVLELRKKVLGNEHPDTLLSTSNLAVTYWKQGRLEDAEELELQGLELEKKVLGEEHPNTLASMASLAMTLRKALGRDHNAIELMQKSVDLHVKVVGSDHPDTIMYAEMVEKWRNQPSSPTAG